MERLDKMLANAGVGSRSDVKAIIRAGRVRLNGEIIKDESKKAGENDEILLDGKPIRTSGYRYFMLNKPKGVVSATEDPSEKTVVDILKNEHVKGLFPVGRLDKDTTGLLILTNDGEFGHRMTSPNRKIDKVYEAVVKGIPDANAIAAFATGFIFKEFTSQPAELVILEKDEASNTAKTRVTIHEGKFHQVKRMFLKVNCEVLELKRISMGEFILDENLAEGEYKEIIVGDEV